MDHETITFESLCPDRCNFIGDDGRALSNLASAFQRREMPSFPLGLLQCAEDNWEIHQRPIVEVTVYWNHAAQAWEHNGDESPRDGRAAVADVTERQDSYTDSDFDPADADYDGIGATVYVYRGEAFPSEEDAYRHRDANRYGHPWANGLVFMAADHISTETLQAAGFVVADYYPEGPGIHAPSYRLCGIDGGGYNFLGAHFAPLYVRWLNQDSQDSRRPARLDTGLYYIDNPA